jgi:hypothetical protein
MRLRLQVNPAWRAPSGDDRALAQGAWAGGAAIVLLTVAGLAGDIGFVVAIALTAGLPGAMVPLALGDLLVTRRAIHRWVDGSIIAAAAGVLAWTVISFVLPSGVSAPPTPPDDAWEVAAPTLAGLLLSAERCAARDLLVWRDRALGAATGYAVVGGVFLVGIVWLSWAVLLALLPLRLPRPARVAFAVLAGAAALGLGELVDGTWATRAVELAAFLGYAAVSLALDRLRPMPPKAAASAA